MLVDISPQIMAMLLDRLQLALSRFIFSTAQTLVCLFADLVCADVLLPNACTALFSSLAASLPNPAFSQRLRDAYALNLLFLKRKKQLKAAFMVYVDMRAWC
jgi:hypothetical protein